MNKSPCDLLRTRHPRVGGDPSSPATPMDSRLRGNDGKGLKCAVILIAAFCLLTFTAWSAHAANDDVIGLSDVPVLPSAFSIKWDISKNNNPLVQDFTVNKRDPISLFHLLFSPIESFQTKSHPYEIGISFQTTNPNKYFTSAELKQVDDFLGCINLKSGTSIPVSIKIEKIDSDNAVPPLLDKTINTVGCAAWSSGWVERLIDTVVIPPGKYRITLSTPHAIKIPPNVKTFLWISHSFK